MSSAVAVREKIQQVVETIDRPEFQQQLREALPEGLSVERFTRTTKIALQMNPEVLETDRLSLFRAMVRCAQDGLLPDGREAALIKVKVKGTDTCSYWPMVGGLRKKAAENGISLTATVVYERDTFEYALGVSPVITHVPPGLSSPRGEAIGAYAVARDRNGQVYVEVMSREEIEAVRATSRAATSEYGPWVKWWGEMARKTVARRLWKQLPLGALPEATARVLDAADERDLDVATAPVPALAGLPVLDTVEVVEEVEVVE